MNSLEEMHLYSKSTGEGMEGDVNKNTYYAFQKNYQEQYTKVKVAVR